MVNPLRLGIFGGTFDPPHFGHLHLAAAARTQLKLGKVLWVVTADPPHKRGRILSAVEDRAAMVQAAIAPEPGYELSRVDIDRPGPHWAVDTVAVLAQQFPDAQLIYLMGGDSLRDLPTWGRPLDFLAHCKLGVLRRPETEIDFPALERVLPGLTAKVEFIEVTPLDIASHIIRRRARAGLEIAALVPEAVARLICGRKLYAENAVP